MHARYWIGALAAVVIALGAGFWGGMNYGQQRANDAIAAVGNTVVAGIVTAVSPSSITLQLSDGSQESFALASTTQVLATVAAGQQAPTLASLPAGALVSVVLVPDASGAEVVNAINVAPSSVPQ